MSIFESFMLFAALAALANYLEDSGWAALMSFIPLVFSIVFLITGLILTVQAAW